MFALTWLLSVFLFPALAIARTATFGTNGANDYYDYSSLYRYASKKSRASAVLDLLRELEMTFWGRERCLGSEIFGRGLCR